MIKQTKENNYEYKHLLGTIVVDDVKVGVSDKGRRSLAASEIERLSRLAALEFLKKNYRRALEDQDFTLRSKSVRGIIGLLNVNQMEFGILVGCKKAKVSKILANEQAISRSQALLALERLAMEVVRPGSTRYLLGNVEGELAEPDNRMAEEINGLRFEPHKKAG
jgi:ABC-type sugar transport system ATPase subunit